MGGDLTKKLSVSDTDTILTAIKNLESYVRSSIDNLVTWVSSIDARLHALEQKVDQRLHGTRPIWHKLVADVAHLQSGQDEMRAQISGLNNTVQELRGDVQDLRRDQGIFNDVIRKVNGDLHPIDERLHRLEVDRKRPNSST